MSRLLRRIAAQPRAAAAGAGEFHPHGTADTPMMMPLVHVQFDGGGAWVQQMMPLITSNGAPIPATAPGQFGHVHIAGGGRY